MKLFNLFTQILIPVLTISGQIALAFKFPQWALVMVLTAQPFWIYSSWKSFKEAGQVGMFINSVIFSVVTLFGFLNYWFL
ncbi:MAG: hypothetical protein WC415_05830 [Patescibacteria group bacterium]|jgi:hypothetical protein